MIKKISAVLIFCILTFATIAYFCDGKQHELIEEPTMQTEQEENTEQTNAPETTCSEPTVVTTDPTPILLTNKWYDMRISIDNQVYDLKDEQLSIKSFTRNGWVIAQESKIYAEDKDWFSLFLTKDQATIRVLLDKQDQENKAQDKRVIGIAIEKQKINDKEVTLPKFISFSTPISYVDTAYETLIKVTKEMEEDQAKKVGALKSLIINDNRGGFQIQEENKTLRTYVSFDDLNNRRISVLQIITEDGESISEIVIKLKEVDYSQIA